MTTDTAQPLPLEELSYERGIDDAAAIAMKYYSEASAKQDGASLMDKLILGHLSSRLACLRSEIVALKEREG